MNRSLFSAALIALLAVTLVWGTCTRCTDFLPVPAESHDCCDKDQAPKPAPMDCAGKLVDFNKATQPDSTKAPLVAADAAAVTLPVMLAAAEPIAAPATLIAAHCPLLTSPLRI